MIFSSLSAYLLIEQNRWRGKLVHSNALRVGQIGDVQRDGGVAGARFGIPVE